MIHPVVDDGVDAGIRHGQPVEAKVDVAYVRVPGDGGVVVAVDEVDVVGGPTHHEDDNNKCEHLDNLLLVIPALGESCLRNKKRQS